MYGINGKCVPAIKDYRRTVKLRVDVCQPRGEGDDSRQAFARSAKAIRALPTPHDADPEIAQALMDDHVTTLEVLKHLENSPLNPEARRDPYGWLRSVTNDRVNDVDTSGRPG